MTKRKPKPVGRATLSTEEIAAILAGLRLLQSTPLSKLPEAVRDVFTEGGAAEPLSNAEIDGLCEAINLADAIAIE